MKIIIKFGLGNAAFAVEDNNGELIEDAACGKTVALVLRELATTLKDATLHAGTVGNIRDTTNGNHIGRWGIMEDTMPPEPTSADDEPDYFCPECGQAFYCGEVDKGYAMRTGWQCSCGSPASHLIEVKKHGQERKCDK